MVGKAKTKDGRCKNPGNAGIFIAVHTFARAERKRFPFISYAEAVAAGWLEYNKGKGKLKAEKPCTSRRKKNCYKPKKSNCKGANQRAARLP